MNCWRSRLLFGVLLWGSMQLHAYSMGGMPNTPLGMMFFHGSAALLDLLLLYCAPAITNGRLCDDIQTLCLFSIAGNTLGWIAYLAYAPPIFYDVSMWLLSVIQWGRLLFVDTGDADNLGADLVRGTARRSA